MSRHLKTVVVFIQILLTFIGTREFKESITSIVLSSTNRDDDDDEHAKGARGIQISDDISYNCLYDKDVWVKIIGLIFYIVCL